ncbi:SDR family NAD(P)-dependent oxidoreductase [Acinetobacter gerneri]|uniref:SDR family NAD(P)-dependent oxidoreductase n=1 Tax=Acinetobacter gerneri TaxID=202952 RepID=A0AAW8JC09_9GAMM|nr:SDR family NAD(P)-dependent oxidoreductase [Acinetobacter gerneri]MDQ9009860.1 SDR family NAD(P)-dependent oxidoreductase [Acinetobacter gerneri]MDQ9013898.1 SDR family NAD(P)-dependent oxidoreductase [Acinetobacter gerneri]MDQ9023647.1 SDR family NAD(P)-dependent oxidoreductase [Acinetobacter gerneri]MDQ9052524.1 SDR family NAD(P)-dependent oxidoreductase [Acinetobacter gerneri]MDQ9059968.1 SDR family NAD(P)-dependent oxidoreductase [Acinetobacter gerneri]
MKITDAVVFITGANRGLGLILAKEAIQRGAKKVYAAMRNTQNFNEKGMIAVRVDVTDPITIEKAIAECGDVNILINNAGIARLNQSPVEVEMARTTRKVLETNLYGMINTTQLFTPILKHNSEGYIVNILSDVSWQPSTFLASYAISKSAAWSFTNSTRQWLAEDNVHVMGVHVGFIDTDLTQSLDIEKVSPKVVAEHVFDGIEQNAFEVLVGESSQQLKQGLSAKIPSYITL